MRSGQKTGFARQVRRRLTDAERALWHHLRNRALLGCKFRRQLPIGPYVVDFACVEYRLVVELDGGQHAGPCRDAARSRYLHANGYRVLRFWNNDAFQEQEAVLAMIYDALQRRALTPTPLPHAGEGLECREYPTLPREWDRR
jgi:very-short-patch-repair endonuclease